MGNGSDNGEAAGPGAAVSFSSNCHLRHRGGGAQGSLLSFLAFELETPPKVGETQGEWDKRHREALRVCVCVHTSV